MKPCLTCGERKPADAYYWGRNQCQECVRRRERERYWRDRERRKEATA